MCVACGLQNRQMHAHMDGGEKAECQRRLRTVEQSFSVRGI